ncbi:MAG: glycine betaine ABC transporter substrate-binding protein [Tumebacillaceae bacterium]
MKKKMAVAMSLVVASALLLTACGDSKDTAEGGKMELKIGSKNFTESLILGEMYAQALENAGYPVERKLNLGGTMVAHEALKRGDIDMYPEYTGTGLLDVLKLPVQQDAQAVYDTVAAKYKENWKLDWLTPTKANDSQGLVVSKKVSDQYGLTKVSQLAELAPKLRMAAVPEFEQREDGLKGLKKAYGGFDFSDMKVYDYGIKYRVLQNGEADATVGFTTDGDLTNKELVLLEDDKKFWPPYFVAPVLRDEVNQKDPEVAKVLNSVSEKISSNEVMQNLNAEVDIQKREYAEVAKEFLQKQGILSK